VPRDRHGRQLDFVHARRRFKMCPRTLGLAHCKVEELEKSYPLTGWRYRITATGWMNPLGLLRMLPTCTVRRRLRDHHCSIGRGRNRNGGRHFQARIWIEGGEEVMKFAGVIERSGIECWKPVTHSERVDGVEVQQPIPRLVRTDQRTPLCLWSTESDASAFSTMVAGLSWCGTTGLD